MRFRNFAAEHIARKRRILGNQLLKLLFFIDQSQNALLPRRAQAMHDFLAGQAAQGRQPWRCNLRHATFCPVRRLTIGAYPDWKVVAAREEARRLKREIDQGVDPMGKRQDLRPMVSLRSVLLRHLQNPS